MNDPFAEIRAQLRAHADVAFVAALRHRRFPRALSGWRGVARASRERLSGPRVREGPETRYGFP
jgi:hypothetical protein